MYLLLADKSWLEQGSLDDSSLTNTHINSTLSHSEKLLNILLEVEVI